MKLKDKKVLVTGGAGFIGSHVVDKLQEVGCKDIIIPRSSECNLLDINQIDGLFKRQKPDVVIHLAAKVGGIIDIKNKPGEYFYENILMGTQLLEVCRKYHIEKFVAIGTNCSYPENITIPFKEIDLFNGYPQKTNASYGISKRALYQQCVSYYEQYGIDFIYLIPTNAYGERDHFDESAHVVPALINKFMNACKHNISEVVIMGSGKATREFMYVQDVAQAIVDATQFYEDREPLNIGIGVETSIKELALTIKDLIGYTGTINWDTTKPEGYLRKCLCNEKMKKQLPVINCTQLRDGLQKTIDWRKSTLNYKEA